MPDMRISTLFHILLWAFCAYYVWYIATPNIILVINSFPDLWTIVCGPTRSSSLISFMTTGVYYRETECSLGGLSIQITKHDPKILAFRAPQALDHVVKTWCDRPRTWFGDLGPEICHLALDNGQYEISVPKMLNPTIEGAMLFLLFRQALGYLMAPRRK